MCFLLINFADQSVARSSVYKFLKRFLFADSVSYVYASVYFSLFVIDFNVKLGSEIFEYLQLKN